MAGPPKASGTDDVVALLHDAVSRRRGTRVLVGIDGPDAAGKTTLADALARRMPGSIRASIDGFHHPRAHRLRRGPLSPEGYYRDSFDLDALARLLLEPFSSGEDAVVLKCFDAGADAGVSEQSARVHVGPSAVLVFDGVFLQRPELRSWWDLAVYLHVDPEVTLARARTRDVDLFGSEAEIDRRYLGRYLPGQALYRGEAEPLVSADAVIDNTDAMHPRVLRMPTV